MSTPPEPGAVPAPVSGTPEPAPVSAVSEPAPVSAAPGLPPVSAAPGPPPGDSSAASLGAASGESGGDFSDGPSEGSLDGSSGDGESGVGERRSGLRNPAAAVRGLGAGTLGMEAIVLLLAIQPIRIMGGHLGGWGVGAVVALALFAAVLAGMMRRRWAWNAGTVLQALLIVSGLLHWSLAVLGLIFGAAWAYATYVRHTILS